MKTEITDCPLESALLMLSGRWRTLIIYWLSSGPMRFNALQRADPRLSQQMLSRDLKHLEAAGVVSRSVIATVPPQVEYALTVAGHRLIPILTTLGDWWDDTRTIKPAAEHGVVDPANEPQ